MVSARELSLHGGEVVCPQCLHHTIVAGYEPPVTDATSPQSPAGDDADYNYCYHCGKRLPATIDALYCPYCGTSLKPDTTPAPSAPPEPTPPATTSPAAAVATPARNTPQAEPQRVNMTFLPSSFVPSWFDEQQRQPASLRFRIVAGCVIIVLLAVLAYILRAIALIP